VLRRLILCVFAIALVAPVAAVAHVTIQPGEWEAGAFARMVVRVPNERDDAETTTIRVQFPENVPSARFQTHPSCEREVQREPLAEPIEDLTERIVSVTWTCDPAIPADGFDKLGISFQIPEDAAEGDEILFPATQTYSSGEVVEWIDPDPEGESPAPRVTVIAAEEEEEAAAPAATSTEEAAPVPASSSDDDDNMSTVAIVFGIAGLAAGLIALGVALFRKPKGAATA
jgi:periplasmic copper chaperone A